MPYGTIKSSPEDPETHQRVFDVALPPKEVLSTIPEEQRPTVLIVDSQLKSGASQSAIRDIIKEHFDRDLNFHHAALIANGVKSPPGLEPELKMQELFEPSLNTNPRLPKHLPSFLAYISLANIKPPEGMS